MRTKINHRKPASVGKTRWAAYAAAGAATALAGSNSAEAAIHYSGILNVSFPPRKDHAKTFPLDQPGDFISFERIEQGSFFATNAAYFRIYGIVSAGFRGSLPYTYYIYVSKLHFGEKISEGYFYRQPHASYGGFLDRKGLRVSHSQWADRGIGYVGFRFNNGAGIQYGWARVRMVGHPENAFKVLDYAYGDPGESIRAGQRSSDEKPPQHAPDQGSLGGLALGAAGLLAWRKSRSRTAR
jgi:hypothetical protein